MKNPIIVGRFGRVFGIKGWIYVNSFTDPKENILTYSPWWGSISQEENKFEKLIVTKYQKHEKGIRVKIKDFDNPEAARDLVNKDIAVPRNALPTLNPNQYYWSELEGLAVNNVQGVFLGYVDRLFETGSNDVVVVKNQKQEYWIPFLPSVVLEVNLREKNILVEWDAEF